MKSHAKERNFRRLHILNGWILIKFSMEGSRDCVASHACQNLQNQPTSQVALPPNINNWNSVIWGAPAIETHTTRQASWSRAEKVSNGDTLVDPTKIHIPWEATMARAKGSPPRWGARGHRRSAVTALARPKEWKWRTYPYGNQRSILKGIQSNRW